MLKGVENLSEDLLKKMLEVHRMQRHDFMNYLQIIYGYLQLGNPEKAKEYLLNAVESVQSCGQLSKISLPFLQSFLIWCVTQFNNSHHVFEVVLNGIGSEWQDVDEELTLILRELLSSVQDSLSNNDLKCKLSFLDNSSGFSLLFLGRDDCLHHLKKQKCTSHLLSVVCEEITQGELAVTIKRR